MTIMKKSLTAPKRFSEYPFEKKTCNNFECFILSDNAQIRLIIFYSWRCRWDIQLTENNGSVSENGERQDRPVRPGRTVAHDPDSVSRHHKSVKPNSGNKSWFSETYSAWPLRRIGAALREDRSNTGNVVKIGARNPTEVGRQRKTVI